jgi:hypothetical protein
MDKRNVFRRTDVAPNQKTKDLKNVFERMQK